MIHFSVGTIRLDRGDVIFPGQFWVIPIPRRDLQESVGASKFLSCTDLIMLRRAVVF